MFARLFVKNLTVSLELNKSIHLQRLWWMSETWRRPHARTIALFLKPDIVLFVQ